MGLALEQAQKARALGEVPVGCVIVKDGTVIGAGYNRRETDKTVLGHAELMAMKQAEAAIGDWRLTDCTLYVTLEPCPMCAGAMVMAGLEKCVFGAYDEKQGCCGSVYLLTEDPAFYHRVETVGGVMEAQCRQVLQNFFVNKRM